MQPQHGSSDCIHPPRSQAHHHKLSIGYSACRTDHTSDDGKNQSFHKKQCANLRGWKTDGLKDAYLSQALLNAEFEKECSQQQCRGNQKETEVKEILTKICGATR